MKIVGLVDDLLMLSKIEGIIKQLNLSIKFLSAEDIESRNFDHVIVDMHHKDAFNIMQKFPAKCICFGAHTRTDLFEKAKDLGCKKVYPRSVFFDKLTSLLKW